MDEKKYSESSIQFAMRTLATTENPDEETENYFRHSTDPVALYALGFIGKKFKDSPRGEKISKDLLEQYKNEASNEKKEMLLEAIGNTGSKEVFKLLKEHQDSPSMLLALRYVEGERALNILLNSMHGKNQVYALSALTMRLPAGILEEEHRNFIENSLKNLEEAKTNSPLQSQLKENLKYFNR